MQTPEALSPETAARAIQRAVRHFIAKIRDQKDRLERQNAAATIINLAIPRPGQPGVGRIFVQYSDAAEAATAAAALHGRSFGGNVVNAAYFDEARFAQGDLA